LIYLTHLSQQIQCDIEKACWWWQECKNSRQRGRQQRQQWQQWQRQAQQEEQEEQKEQE
jgi:hypothetical protein